MHAIKLLSKKRLKNMYLRFALICILNYKSSFKTKTTTTTKTTTKERTIRIIYLNGSYLRNKLLKTIIK